MQSDISFTHETVLLDGESFDSCSFIACRMVYSGGEVPSFAGCKFDDCEWKYEESASRTLSYLKLIWSVGAKATVQSTIKEITVAAR